jgi:hypothetical protein
MFLIYSWMVFGLLVSMAAGPMLLIYRYNKRMSQIPCNGCLTTRFQYNDNALVLRIFLPLFVIGVFGVGTLCSAIILYIYIQLEARIALTIQHVILIRVTSMTLSM